MARIRDLMMDMYNSDEEDDYNEDEDGDEGEERVAVNERAAVRQAPPQPADQRGEIYDDLLETVQLVSNCRFIH